MSEPNDVAVLRNAVMHAQPRSLRRQPQAMLPSQPAVRPNSEVSKPLADSAGKALPGGAAGLAAEHAAALARGREDGFRAGFADGIQGAERRLDDAIAAANAEAQAAGERALREADVERATALARLQSIGAAFQSAAAERLETLEHDVIELAFAAVCSVVGEQPQTAAHIEGVVRTAMAALHGAKLLRVRSHPADMALLDTGSGVMPDLAGVEWVADPEIDTGGCVLDADRGSIDARLATQLDQLRKRWIDALHATTSPTQLSRAA